MSSGKGSAITTPSEVYKRWAIMIHRREGDRHETTKWLSAPPQASQRTGAVWSAPARQPSAPELAITDCLSRSVAPLEEPVVVEPVVAVEPVVVEPVVEEPVAVEAVVEEPEPEDEPTLLPTPTVPYEAWTRAALYEKAKQVELPGRSSMTKAMLAQKLWERTAA